MTFAAGSSHGCSKAQTGVIGPRVTVPVSANDDYITKLAQLIRNLAIKPARLDGHPAMRLLFFLAFQNKVAILDPGVSMPDPVSGNAANVMKEVLTVVGPVIIPLFGTTPKHKGCVKASKSLLGKIVKEKFSIGQHGHIALATDTEGNMIGLHSMQ